MTKGPIDYSDLKVIPGRLRGPHVGWAVCSAAWTSKERSHLAPDHPVTEHERLTTAGVICPYVFNRHGKPIRDFGGGEAMNTLQRVVWDGHPVSLGNAFERRKPKGLRERHALCRLDTPRFGYELRFEVNGLMSRTQVCRSKDEVLDLSEQWRAAMLEKGWQEKRSNIPIQRHEYGVPPGPACKSAQ